MMSHPMLPEPPGFARFGRECPSNGAATEPSIPVKTLTEGLATRGPVSPERWAMPINQRDRTTIDECENGRP